MNTITEWGLLLPTASMSLAASSPAGAAAIAAFGRPSPADFDEAFEAWESRLRERGDAEDLLGLEAGRRIATVAAQADGWLSLTHPGSARSTPGLVLVGPEAHLGAFPHGETVEWLAGDGTLAGRLVGAVLDDEATRPLMVTAFRDAESLAGVLFENGEASVAGRDDETVGRLTEAANDGAAGLVHALIDLIGVV